MLKKIDHLDIYIRSYTIGLTLTMLLMIFVCFSILAILGNNFLNVMFTSLLICTVAYVAFELFRSYHVLFSISDTAEKRTRIYKNIKRGIKRSLSISFGRYTASFIYSKARSR